MSTGRVYLTFDDGPDARCTPAILDMLAAARTKATFFVVGRYALQHSALLRRAVAEGHEIGNHTYRHRHPMLLSRRAARNEVLEGMCAIADTTGLLPTVFRPPHGYVRSCMVDEAAAWGQVLVLWTVSAIDWGLAGTEKGITTRLQQVKANDIVLMHDGGYGINQTSALLAVLPEFLADLQSRNLESATLDSDDFPEKCQRRTMHRLASYC